MRLIKSEQFIELMFISAPSSQQPNAKLLEENVAGDGLRLPSSKK